MKTKFTQPRPLPSEQTPLIVHVARPRGRPGSPRPLGRVRFAQYVSFFERGRPPLQRSASESVAQHVQHWRRDIAEAEHQAEDRARRTVWRMVRQAFWRWARAACCCGAR